MGSEYKRQQIEEASLRLTETSELLKDTISDYVSKVVDAGLVPSRADETRDAIWDIYLSTVEKHVACCERLLTDVQEQWGTLIRCLGQLPSCMRRPILSTESLEFSGQFDNMNGQSLQLFQGVTEEEQEAEDLEGKVQKLVFQEIKDRTDEFQNRLFKEISTSVLQRIQGNDGSDKGSEPGHIVRDSESERSEASSHDIKHQTKPKTPWTESQRWLEIYRYIDRSRKPSWRRRSDSSLSRHSPQCNHLQYNPPLPKAKSVGDCTFPEIEMPSPASSTLGSTENKAQSCRTPSQSDQSTSLLKLPVTIVGKAYPPNVLFHGRLTSEVDVPEDGFTVLICDEYYSFMDVWYDACKGCFTVPLNGRYRFHLEASASHCIRKGRGESYCRFYVSRDDEAPCYVCNCQVESLWWDNYAKSTSVDESLSLKEGEELFLEARSVKGQWRTIAGAVSLMILREF